MKLCIFLFVAWVMHVCSAKLVLYEYTCFSYKVIDEHENIIEIRCNSTEVFSPAEGKCVVPTKNFWPCDKGMDCHDKDDRRFADKKEGCKTYYTCYRQVFFGHNYCPGNLIFNEEGQYCDWVYNVAPPCGTFIGVKPNFG